MSKERAFIENWWKRKFSMPNLSTGDDVIMVSHALELLKAFRGAGDAKWMWGSVLSLADAEELLIEFRKSTQAT